MFFKHKIKDSNVKEEINDMKHKIIDINKEDIDLLIDDENEAIEAYRNAIEKAKKSKDEKLISKFQEIMNDEMKHVRELKSLIDNKIEMNDDFSEESIKDVLKKELETIKNNLLGEHFTKKSTAENTIANDIEIMLKNNGLDDTIQSNILPSGKTSVIRTIFTATFLDGKHENHGVLLKGVLGAYVDYDANNKFTISSIKMREPHITFEEIDDVNESNVEDSKYPHLDALIAKLNAPIDGESLFDFTYKIDGDMIRIYDKNEVYNYDYDEDTMWLLEEASEEFGFEFNPKDYKSEDYMGQFEEALKQDGLISSDGYLDWENSVVMITYLDGKNYVKDSNKYIYNVYQNDVLIDKFDGKAEAMNACSSLENAIIKYEHN